MNRKFTDRHGNEWKIVIGLYTARRIKEQSEGLIDFVDTSRVQSAKNALVAMAEDVELSMRVFWWLCESQIKERWLAKHPRTATETRTESERWAEDGEADEGRAFGDSFDLDILGAANMAVAEAVIDFFPSRHRAALRRAAEIALAAFETEMEVVDQQMAELVESKEFETMITEAVTAGTRSGNSLDLRELDPVTYSVAHPNSASDNST